MKRILPYFTYANVVSTLCLFLLLGRHRLRDAEPAEELAASKQLKAPRGDGLMKSEAGLAHSSPT